MKKLKKIYAVHCFTKMRTIGLQYVKADTGLEARRKFRKKYPKLTILDLHRVWEPNHRQTTYAI